MTARRQHRTDSSAAITADERRRVRAVLALGGVPRDDLDDATQQAQLRLLEHLDTGREPLRTRAAWLCVVASRIAVDWHRAHTRQEQLSERLSARWVPTTADDEDSRVLALHVARLLERLPAEQRQLLVLRYYGDLTVPELAAHLGIPAGTVKSRLHSALGVAREALQDRQGASEGRT